MTIHSETDRDRKLRFIGEHGSHHNPLVNLEYAVAKMLARVGPDFLTDEQIEEIAAASVNEARARNHRTIRDRPIPRASAGLGLASALGGMLSQEGA